MTPPYRHPKGNTPGGRVSAVSGIHARQPRFTYATLDFEVEYLMDFDPRDFEDEALIFCAIFVWLIITVVLK